MRSGGQDMVKQDLIPHYKDPPVLWVLTAVYRLVEAFREKSNTRKSFA